MKMYRTFLLGLAGLCLAAGESARADEIVVVEKTGAAVQAAIDAVAATGGGRVILRGGVYESATLYLKSHVELHLEADAILRGAPKPNAYDDVDDPRIGKRPERSMKAFIVCLDGEDVAITGKGVIDGQGLAFYDTNVPSWQQHFAKPPHPRTRMVQFFKCRNVRFSGVTFKDSPGWTFWLRMCRDITVSDITVDGDQRMINNDGLHFDGCAHVRVGDSHFKTGDDCFIMRANRSPNGDSSLSEDFVVSNCVFNSSCQGLRLGCPSDGTIRNARFSNITFRGNNGVLSYHPNRYLQRGTRGSCVMEDIVIEDCDIDVSGSPIVFAVDPGITLGTFGNVTLRNLKVKGKAPIRLCGTAETPLVNMTLENVTGTIAAPNPLDVTAVRNLRCERLDLSSGPTKPTPFTWDWKSDSWECEP